MTGTIERVLKWAWREHYKIPPLAASGAIAIALVAAWAAHRYDFGLHHEGWPTVRNLTVVSALVGGVLVLGRWHWDRWKTRGGLVLPLFGGPASADHAGPLQSRVAGHLQDVLPPEVSRRIHRISAVVSSGDRELASKLHRRLQARFLVYGDLVERHEKVQAHTRVMERIARPVFHKDYFTKDVTPAFTWKARLAHRLSASRDVTDYELPPELATELNAIMRVMAGEVLRMGNDPAAVESMLTDVLTICGNNQSPRVDFLVADLAEALLQQGKLQEALALTRPRADRPDPPPAPTLLRTAHHAVFESLEALPLDQHRRQQLHAAGVTWLRRAAQDLADPGRDQSLYNLVMALSEDDPVQVEEAVELLHELRRISPHYRSAWYVYRLLGAMTWRDVTSADDRKDRLRAATASARWYSRAIRARPRAKWFYVDQTGTFHFLARFHRSPIMYANAAEAHESAGHPVRGKYHGTRAARARKRLYEAATRAAKRDDWWGAYVNYDRARTSWQDELDVIIGVGRAISAQASGFLPDHLVERCWLEATDAPGPVDLSAVTAFLVSEWEKGSA